MAKKPRAQKNIAPPAPETALIANETLRGGVRGKDGVERIRVEAGTLLTGDLIAQLGIDADALGRLIEHGAIVREEVQIAAPGDAQPVDLMVEAASKRADDAEAAATAANKRAEDAEAALAGETKRADDAEAEAKVLAAKVAELEKKGA